MTTPALSGSGWRRVPSAFLTSLVLTTAACAQPQPGPSRVEAENEIAIRTLMAMWESGDAEDVAGLFHPDAVYDDFPNQQQYRGLQEIGQYLTSGSSWAEGVNMSVTAVHVSETGAVAEWVFSGVQDHPMGSLVPMATGREVVLNGVTVIEVDGGRIRRAADYMDVLPLVLQLGGRVSLPGGGTLSLDPAPPAENGPPGEDRSDDAGRL